MYQLHEIVLRIRYNFHDIEVLHMIKTIIKTIFCIILGMYFSLKVSPGLWFKYFSFYFGLVIILML